MDRMQQQHQKEEKKTTTTFPNTHKERETLIEAYILDAGCEYRISVFLNHKWEMQMQMRELESAAGKFGENMSNAADESAHESRIMMIA